MAFSAALSLGGSLLGAVGGMFGANAAAEAAMYDASLRRETENDILNLSRQQMGIGMDLLGRENGLLDYAYDQNRQGQQLAIDQRDYARTLVEQDRARALLERNYQLQRVQQLDYAANQEYQRRLASLQNNTQITTSERNRALQEMERAQQIAQQERQQQMLWYQQDIGRLEQERDQALSYLDYNRDLAASERTFDIGELRRGQQTAASEREQALGLLEQSRQTAESERAQDVGQFERAATQRMSERAFQEAEYRQARAQAMAERNYDIQRRNMLDDATNRYGQALEQTISRFGPMAPVEYLGEADVAAESARREQVAVDDINSMADRVASINEANLIRGGMDASTRATAERSDVAARLGEEMAKARTAARSEAVQYVAGINDQIRLSDEMERLRRQSGIEEVAQAYGVPVQMLMQSPDVRSALGGPQFTDVGSAVYDRALVSGNDYSAPISVGSGNFNMGVGSATNYGSPLSVNSSMLSRDFGSANDYSSPLAVGSGVYAPSDASLGSNMSGVYDFASGIGPGAANRARALVSSFRKPIFFKSWTGI